MARESSLVPCNLLNWPKCDSLLPDQRLIWLWLWSAPFLSCAGCGQMPLRPSAATLGLQPEALMGGLKDLDRLKLIKVDFESMELFILDWFRFHKFNSTVAKKMLENAVKNIQSEALKNEISIKSASYLPTSTSTSTSTNTCRQIDSEGKGYTDRLADSLVKKFIEKKVFAEVAIH